MTVTMTEYVCFRNDTKEDVFVHQVSCVYIYIYILLLGDFKFLISKPNYLIFRQQSRRTTPGSTSVVWVMEKS